MHLHQSANTSNTASEHARILELLDLDSHFGAPRPGEAPFRPLLLRGEVSADGQNDEQLLAGMMATLFASLIGPERIALQCTCVRASEEHRMASDSLMFFLSVFFLIIN